MDRSLRYLYSIAFLAIIVSAARLSMFAQDVNDCYGSPRYDNCKIPDGSCSRIVPTVTPAVIGEVYVWTQTYCCGYQVLYPYYPYTQCQVTELRDPEIILRLVAMPGKGHILVAGCDGYLRHLPHWVLTPRSDEGTAVAR